MQPEKTPLHHLHAQGATEYLVMLGVVLIIGLVTISMLGSAIEPAGQAGETESWVYWKGSAYPIRVDEATTIGRNQTVCGDYSGGYQLVLENSQADSIVIRGASIDGEAAEICYASSQPTTSISLQPGERKLVEFGTEAFPYYNSGQRVEIGLEFDYDGPNLAGRKQVGSKKLVFRAGEGGTLLILLNQSLNQTGNQTGNQTAVCGAGCCHEGEACVSISDCCGSMFCGAGACAKCKKRNEACAADSQCCSNAQFCSQGVCSQCRTQGEACSSDNECCSNAQHCTGGVCAT